MSTTIPIGETYLPRIGGRTKIKVYTDVPDMWKLAGMYQQPPAGAPKEIAQYWFPINLMDHDPWNDVAVEGREPVATLKPGFEKVFGKRPQLAQFASKAAFTAYIGEWERNHQLFVREVKPAELGVDAGLVERMTGFLTSFGMGQPRHWDGGAQHGFMTNFPDNYCGYLLEMHNRPGGAFIYEKAVYVAGDFQMQVVQSIESGAIPAEYHPKERGLTLHPWLLLATPK